MEESALLTNITMIITKDILVDEANSQKKPKHFLWHSNQTETDVNNDLRFPLLEPADDEDMEFFLKQQFFDKPTKSENGSGCSKKHGVKDGQVCKKRMNETIKLGKFQTSNKRQELDSQKGDTAAVRRNVKKPKELNLLNRFDNIEFEGHLHMSKMSFLVRNSNLLRFRIITLSYMLYKIQLLNVMHFFSNLHRKHSSLLNIYLLRDHIQVECQPRLYSPYHFGN